MFAWLFWIYLTIPILKIAWLARPQSATSWRVENETIAPMILIFSIDWYWRHVEQLISLLYRLLANTWTSKISKVYLSINYTYRVCMCLTGCWWCSDPSSSPQNINATTYQPSDIWHSDLPWRSSGPSSAVSKQTPSSVAIPNSKTAAKQWMNCQLKMRKSSLC